MARKKTAKRTTGTGKKRDVLVVASKVKAYVRAHNMNTSGEAIQCLSDKIYGLLDEATTRTKMNGRKTVKAQDI